MLTSWVTLTWQTCQRQLHSRASPSKPQRCCCGWAAFPQTRHSAKWEPGCGPGSPSLHPCWWSARGEWHHCRSPWPAGSPCAAPNSWSDSAPWPHCPVPPPASGQLQKEKVENSNTWQQHSHHTFSISSAYMQRIFLNCSYLCGISFSDILRIFSFTSIHIVPHNLS